MSLFDENEAAATANAQTTPETTPENTDAEKAPVETKEQAKARLKAEKEAEKAAKDAKAALEAEAAAELEAEEKAEAEAKAKAAPKASKSTWPRYVEGQKPAPGSIKNDSDMRNYLMSFPKVMVMVPLIAGEKPGSTEPVLVNGIRLNIMKGTMVEVPKPFADQIFQHYNIGQLEGSLGSESRIDGNTAKEAALN